MKKKILKIIKTKNIRPLVCLTAYSKPIAKILDKYCDMILVGDSMANVLYGMTNTHNLTLDNIIQHSISVSKGIKKSALIVDMPKGTYSNLLKAKKNAQLIIKKTKCSAVKIESNNKNYVGRMLEIKCPKSRPITGCHSKHFASRGWQCRCRFIQYQ